MANNYKFILVTIGLLTLFSEVGFGQNKTVQGSVTDSTGKTLPGVNIKVKGTLTGTTTDKKGNYSLSVPSLQDTLVFSYIGYKRKSVNIHGRGIINIKLHSKTLKTGKVVVTAFGQEKKAENLVGAVSSISSKELSKVPTSNLTTALAGRVSGLISFQRNGEPGRNNAQIYIRGEATFGYNKSPLILIDGVESSTNALARLVPEDIKNFSILKDATATSVYGSRASNGVILVKTKEGHNGATKFSVRLENSLSKPTTQVHFADPIRYMQIRNATAVSRNPLGLQPYSQKKIDQTAAGNHPLLYPATNWKKRLFKNYSINQRYYLNVKGGGDKANYFVSGSFSQDNGLMKVDPINNYNNNIDLKTYSIRSNVNAHLTDNTTLLVKLNGFFDDYTGPLNTGGAIYKKVISTDPVRFPAKYPQKGPYKNVQHTLFGNYKRQGGLRDNPYADLVKGYKNYDRTQLNAQFGFNHNFSSIDNLDISARSFISRYSFFQVRRSITPYFYNARSFNEQTKNLQLKLLNPDQGKAALNYKPSGKDVHTDFKLRAKLDYNHTFVDRHHLSGLLVYRLQNQLEGSPGSVLSSLPKRNMGISGSASYDYDRRYFVNLNFGYNASERFAKDQRWGFFPSIGLAWNISNEDFWQPLKNIITNFRLRGTYGLSGNSAIGNLSSRFLYLSNVRINDPGVGYTFGEKFNKGRGGISISRYPNPNVTWEKSRKTDFGIKLGLFNKLTLKADYYIEQRSQILEPRSSIATSLGLSAVPQANLGAAINHGIEASIKYQQFFGNDYFINLRANFTFARNRYTKYSEPKYINEPWKSHIGNSISQPYGLIADHLFVDSAEVKNSPHQNYGNYGAGDIKYHDVNGDGQITDLDAVPMGYPTSPEINYGLRLTGGIKNFNIIAFFEGLARQSFFIDPNKTAPFVNNRQLIQKIADNHWSKNNQNSYAFWPRLGNKADQGNNNYTFNTWFLRDGSYMRLRELRVGYSLPQKIFKNEAIRSARIYVTGRNLITWSKFKLWDPEMGGNGLGYPIQSTYTIGARIQF